MKVYTERFAPRHGPLRPVVERVLRGFLTCGLVEHGFGRAECQTCHASYLIPFSCRGRSFCPSCEKKRQLLWAEWLCGELLSAVPHRHAVFTIPRLLRPLFRKRRELLDELAQAGAEALAEAVREALGDEFRPGLVVSIATAADLVQWNPHLHVLTTDGGFSADGSFRPLPAWDAEAVMKLFRQRLLDRLVARKAISQALVEKLLAWRHPGFSSYLGEPIPFEDKKALEDLACYLVRSALSLQKLVYLDGSRAVLYHSKLNPSLGRNFEAMDPLEWLARMADHIPDPGKHRVRFFGHYANRARGARAQAAEALAEGAQPQQDAPQPQSQKKRCAPSWARLIHKVYQADPLRCRSCGGTLRVVAYLSDPIAIRRVLEELGLSPQQNAKPPPAPSEVVRVPVDEEGREIAP